jgi:hypothetical protein
MLTIEQRLEHLEDEAAIRDLVAGARLVNGMVQYGRVFRS